MQRIGGREKGGGVPASAGLPLLLFFISLSLFFFSLSLSLSLPSFFDFFKEIMRGRKWGWFLAV